VDFTKLFEDGFELLDDFSGREHGINTFFWTSEAFNDLNGLNGWNVLNRLGRILLTVDALPTPQFFLARNQQS
jgi:hypothetical protein